MRDCGAVVEHIQDSCAVFEYFIVMPLLNSNSVGIMNFSFSSFAKERFLLIKHIKYSKKYQLYVQVQSDNKHFYLLILI